MVAIKLKSRVNKQVDESNYEIKTDSYNIFEKAKNRSFSAEIENDQNKSKMLLERAVQAESMQADQKIIDQEKKSAAVYKRALLLIGSGNMQITSKSEKTKSATENILPTSSYLSHGSRVLIEIPKDSNSDLINWLTSGNKNIDGRSKQQTQAKAINEQKI